MSKRKVFGNKITNFFSRKLADKEIPAVSVSTDLTDDDEAENENESVASNLVWQTQTIETCPSINGKINGLKHPWYQIVKCQM